MAFAGLPHDELTVGLQMGIKQGRTITPAINHHHGIIGAPRHDRGDALQNFFILAGDFRLVAKQLRRGRHNERGVIVDRRDVAQPEAAAGFIFATIIDASQTFHLLRVFFRQVGKINDDESAWAQLRGLGFQRGGSEILSQLGFA